MNQPTVDPVTESQIRRTLEQAGEALAWTAGYITLPWLKVKKKARVSRDVAEWSISRDGQVTVNPDWFKSIPGTERVFVLACGMLKFLLRHFDRGVALELHDDRGQPLPGKEFDCELWGKAGAMVTNGPLKAEAIGRAPAESLFPPDAYTGPVEAEALWHWLMKNTPKPPPNHGGGSGSGGTGQQPSPHAGGLVQPQSDAPPAEGEEQEQSAQAGQGGLSGDEIDQLRREVEALARQAGRGSAVCDALRPKVARTDWRAVLRAGFDRASTEAAERTKNTYSRASRREALTDGVLLPGKVGEDPSIAVVMDASGSVSRELVKKAASEALKLSSQYPGTRVYFVTHTDRVNWEGWLKAGGDVQQLTEATGFTGGTDPQPAYDAVRKVAPRGKFDSLVHFTDCEFFTSVWPEVPARRLVVGACGVASSNVQNLATKPPVGARVIPVTEGEK